MKGKLAAIGAFLLAAVAFVLGAMSKKTPSKYRERVLDTEIDLHKAAAVEARKTAASHVEKARTLAAQKESRVSATEDEAIMRWNDDKL